MVRKKIDERVITLIRNGVKTGHRSFFVIVGDKSRDQIKSLHNILGTETNKKANVLWCYNDKLELSSHKKKQAKQMKMIERTGCEDPDKLDEFSLFLQTTNITYCRYKDSTKCLGNTYGMCILQDFQALTPNLIATTIETVKGGGFIILLIHSLSTLTSLYTMVMDVHKRFRPESHSVRFNERFLLSLASCTSCMVMDDELNLLPISSHMKSVKPVQVQKDSEGLSKAERDLNDFQEELKHVLPCGPLIKQCCTYDQGKAVGTFLDAILDKTVSGTVALLAGRGRGKSAALGLAVAGAVDAGYSNIFVTAPSPENITTLFDFVLKGLNILEYKEHKNYDIVKSSNPDLGNFTIRIHIYKQHRQTIQYIQPHEHEQLSQVELLVVDEAAAIPLPLVESLLGPYLVFLSSTVNGYEGTGRSLSLNLQRKLEEQSRASSNSTSRFFKRIELSEPIRYASGDPVESWLNNLLCLNIANSIYSINSFPLPSECDLFYVNRDNLFSYHEHSELFLQRMMDLYVASHYKYSPNDLQLLADDQAHQLFVLVGRVNKSRNQLPDILCVIHVCLEGKISKASVMRSLRAGHQPSGDKIPWKFYEQFQDEDFPGLSGARIVRIATHPDADEKRDDYKSAAINKLARFFEGKYSAISKVDVEMNDLEAPLHLKVTEAAKKVSFLKENIKVGSELPPLLEGLGERRPEKLHYLGVSFELTYDLLRFWKKHMFAPFYICEVPNEITGEHTCMMLKSLVTDDIQVNDKLGFVGPYYRDFRSGFATLLCSPKFNTMEYKLALSILDPKLNFTEPSSTTTVSHGSIYDGIIKSPITMKRLKAYLNFSGHHYHLISNLKLPLAYLYFQGKFPVTLTRSQAYVLLIMGLQNQDDSYAVRVTGLDKTTILCYFRQAMQKFYKHLDSVSTKQFTANLPPVKEMFLRPHSVSVDEDLDEAAKKLNDDCKAAKRDSLLNLDFLERYIIPDKDVDFESAMQNGRRKLPAGCVISVKSCKTESDKKRRKNNGISTQKSSKKKRTY